MILVYIQGICVRDALYMNVILHHKIKRNMSIEEKLCQDEVVMYIADRHASTPQEIIALFLSSSETNLQKSCLEDNEKEIIKELIKRSNDKSVL